MINNKEAFEKFNQLKSLLKKLKKCTVAFSGGVDSTFLTMTLKDIFKEDFLAIFVSSPLVPGSEEKDAIKWLNKNKINHKIISYDPLTIPEFYNNPPDRCYYCKREIFTLIKNVATHENFPVVVEGTNLDDMQDYRPGLKALEELNIISPLKEVSLKKDEIRFLSKEVYHLKYYNRPSTACLATRIPYFQEITKEKLLKIEKIEETLNNLGFTLYRARHHGDILRLELPVEDFNRIISKNNLEKVNKVAKELGFKYITLDLEGYSKGKLNQSIKTDKINS